MKLMQVFEKLESVASVELSDKFCQKYSLYDNSGIIIDSGEDVKGVLFSLDLSTKAIEKAQEKGYNLIVTHHPAIYGGISKLKVDDTITQCVKKGISVISMHLNFDIAPEGIDHYLMIGLGGENPKYCEEVDGGAYGRVYDIQPIQSQEYYKKVSKEFSTQRGIFYGQDKLIKKVASFCGAGSSEKTINFAISNNADIFVSSDLKHHEIAKLLECDVNVIHLTHYSAENYGFQKIYKKISASLVVQSEYFTDSALL